ncbi:hypothetical protein [Halomonas stenophila]|uniref:Baseplate protein J-like domain-containing protein n=1 Tax=Halomonas stenophila TaxID=795312 RepID=A0A7W5HM16_9GAMM|nr:hypothetical protein [Halomonas stenophila]MBB3232257.1 hypothetical protein [Halomonas stenophila]
MSVATDGLHCLCPPRFPAHLDADGRPLPKLFADHRIEVFQALSARATFAHWQTGLDDDIGRMVLEWLATLLDNLSFYNHLWTLEQHLATATQEDSLRQLAALTGYQPRPNLAAVARLAVISDARMPLVLPAGREVTSEGNDSHPALSFETMEDAAIDPALNAMTAIPPRETTFDSDFVAIGGSFRNLRVDEPVLFRSSSIRRAAILEEIVNDKFPSGESYAELQLDRSLSNLAGLDLGGIEVKSFVNQSEGRSLIQNRLELQGVQPAFQEDQEIAAIDGENGTLRYDRIIEVTVVNRVLIESETAPVLSPVTRIKLDTYITPGRPHTIFHGVRRAGRLIGAPKTHMALEDFDGRIELEEKYLGDDPDHQGDFVVVDAENRSVAISGSLDVNPHSRRAALELTSISEPAVVLKAPLRIHGNFAEVDQGKTVVETLGSASGRRYQTFRLAKKPLTFLRSDLSDPQPAIEVYVDSVPWRYVPHLFGVAPEDRVYTLRVEADGQAQVILGGVASAGDKNVAARYRHGTTGDNPDAFTVNTPAARIAGIQKVFNPFPALGGLKGDDAEDLRFVLPARISANDRCVSAKDYAVLSRNFGALAARARPYWNAVRKRTAVEVIAVFDGGFDAALANELRDYLAGHAPEGSLVNVVSARPAPHAIGLRLRLTADARAADVKRRVRDIYFHQFTGLLAPRRARIGHAWSRTELLAPLDGIEGILRVEQLSLDGDESASAIAQAADEYLDATLDLEVVR